MSAPREAIVIGGGPGGSACAAALARRGHRVLLLEKTFFPRGHVGESLSPSACEAAIGLGIGDELRAAGFAAKNGATFSWGDDSPWTVNYPPTAGEPAAYQVRRAEFDDILLRAAERAGAEVRQGWRADQIIYSGEQPTGVWCTSPAGQHERLTAPWVVDASGAPGLLNRELGYVPGPPELRNMAVWGYWSRDDTPVDGSARSLLVGRGDTCFWYFPLDNGSRLTSAGIVVRPGGLERLKNDPGAFYRSAIASCEVLAEPLSGALLTGPIQTADAQAYASKQLAGPGWFLVGDAACFVDPLLTPGIQIALGQGALAATALHTILVQPDSQPQALAFYEQVCRREYDTYVQLSRNMYEGARTAGYARGVITSDSPTPDVNGQFAFLSLIGGLPQAELKGALGAYMGLRKGAAARGGAPVVLGEKEGFAFLSWRFHQAVLASARAEGVESELEEASVVLAAAGAGIGDELFLSANGADTLVRKRAVTNKLGDRFEATPALVTLLAVLGTGCSYAEVRRRFWEAMDIPADTGRAEFRDWIDMLAGHALIQWQPPSRGGMCAA